MSRHSAVGHSASAQRRVERRLDHGQRPKRAGSPSAVLRRPGHTDGLFGDEGLFAHRMCSTFGRGTTALSLPG